VVEQFREQVQNQWNGSGARDSPKSPAAESCCRVLASGAGKTTLTRNLLEQEENVSLSCRDDARAALERDRRACIIISFPSAASSRCAIR